ncbi:hypothetical protein F5X96DRAFT_206707 [Biscogniauxia mediterranea]|nr:hypothetical protein F5X96DRAFT_206707 [Biscogniauxia mediterranea]
MGETLESGDERSRSTQTKLNRKAYRITPHRRSRPKGRGQIHMSFRNRPRASYEIPTRKSACSICSPANSTKGEDIAGIIQAVSYMRLGQERLLMALTSLLGSPPSNLDEQRSRAQYTPSFDLSIHPTLHRYFQATLHPDPLKLCDFFLAKYSLPHIMYGSYDPIELIHMHGWEPEDSADTSLILQFADGRNIEIPWRYIDQAKESHLALQITQVAWFIRELWLKQGSSVREQNECDVSLENDEFADPFYLGCPANTKTILYHSTYNPSGAHTAREPWLSPKYPLLGQLQVRIYLRELADNFGSFTRTLMLFNSLAMTGKLWMGTAHGNGKYSVAYGRYKPSVEYLIYNGR